MMAVPYRFAPTIHLTGSWTRTCRSCSPSSRPCPLDERRACVDHLAALRDLSEHESRRRIDHILELCEAAQMPVQLSLDTWWGSTPGGADGRGGFWTDVAYQQVVYNDTQKQFELSIPNRWSSTPWLTMNDPALNEFKASRLRRAAAYLRSRVDAVTTAGAANPILAINLDNEPVYWASGNAGLGNDLLLADFNPTAVAAAAKDGVTLDPIDGLSREERVWLHRNILHYNRIIGDAASAGVGA
jgi:hypothetical protein